MDFKYSMPFQTMVSVIIKLPYVNLVGYRFVHVYLEVKLKGFKLTLYIGKELKIKLCFC